MQNTQTLKYKVVKHKKNEIFITNWERLITYSTRKMCEDFIKTLPVYK